MDTFIALTEHDKQEAFREAAARRGVLPIVIEKDFWVCWTLKHLFEIDELAPHLTFKGGTSLSKAYGLIERFSEDIDLTISKSAPYTRDVKNPADKEISGKERQRRIGVLKEKAQKFVSEVALPNLNKKFQEIFGSDTDWQIEIVNDNNDRQTILFYYPKLLNYGGAFSKEFSSGFQVQSYIKPVSAGLPRKRDTKGPGFVLKPMLQYLFLLTF